MKEFKISMSISGDIEATVKLDGEELTPEEFVELFRHSLVSLPLVEGEDVKDYREGKNETIGKVTHIIDTTENCEIDLSPEEG